MNDCNPEGRRITELFLQVTGMDPEPSYLLKREDDRLWMKLTLSSPFNPESGGMPGEALLKDADHLLPGESASLKVLEGDETLRIIEEAAERDGALGWDGFCDKDRIPGISNAYILYIKYSDGKEVRVQSEGSRPSGFPSFFKTLAETFMENLDYSMLPKTFRASKHLVGVWRFDHSPYFAYIFQREGYGFYDIGIGKRAFLYKDYGDRVSIYYPGDTASMTLPYTIRGKILMIEDSFGHTLEYKKR